MTEDEVERAVERAMDRLDRRLLDGRLTQAEYDKEVSTLDKWSQQQGDATQCLS